MEYSAQEQYTIINSMKITRSLRTIIERYRFNKTVNRWAQSHWEDKSVQSKIMKDYLHLYKTKGLEMDEYYNFEFEKRSESFRKSFLGINEQRHYLDVLNPKKYYILSRNKFLTHKIFENAGIRTSKLYCYYDPYWHVYENEMIGTCLSEVLDILRRESVKSFVVKPTEGTHGVGVIVVKNIEFQNDDAQLMLFDGTSKHLSEMIGSDPLIFESVVHQTNQFSSFNSSSINTLRLITTLYPNGESKIVAGIVRMGRAGVCVDNTGDGGNVNACIDIETGEIKYGEMFNGWRNVQWVEKHPDSGVQLNGEFIENWDCIKSEIIQFQQAFPYCKAAGWDVAVTKDGPLIIEVNDFWDRTFQYKIKRGVRNEIRDCYKAWKEVDYDWLMYRQNNKLSLTHLLKIEGYE